MRHIWKGTAGWRAAVVQRMSEGARNAFLLFREAPSTSLVGPSGNHFVDFEGKLEDQRIIKNFWIAEGLRFLAVCVHNCKVCNTLIGREGGVMGLDYLL